MNWWPTPSCNVEALRKCEVPASEVVLAKSCKGRVVRTPVKTPEDVDFTKDYSKPDSMVQVRVAKQRIERGLGFTSGMKVSYVVTDASKPMTAVFLAGHRGRAGQNDLRRALLH